LGEKLPSSIRFKTPGAIHQAQWMAKAIYSLNIYLFREKFRLTPKEETALRSIYVFIARLYIKVWFNSPSLIKALLQDLTFINKIKTIMIMHLLVNNCLRLQLKISVVTYGIYRQNYVHILFSMKRYHWSLKKWSML